MNRKINCSKISVDCIKNDPVDIRAGGAEILGYDFFVDKKEADKLVKVIKDTLEELKLPLIKISIHSEAQLNLSQERVWTAPRIIQCIIDESDVIISESNRQKTYKK